MEPRLSQEAQSIIVDLEKALMNLSDDVVNKYLNKWLDELKESEKDKDSVMNDSVMGDSVDGNNVGSSSDVSDKGNDKVSGNEDDSEGGNKRKRNEGNDKDDNGKDGKGGKGGKGGNGKGGKGGKGREKKKKIEVPTLQNFIDEFDWKELKGLFNSYIEGGNLKDYSIDGIVKDVKKGYIGQVIVCIKMFFKNRELKDEKEVRKKFIRDLEEKKILSRSTYTKWVNYGEACFTYPIIITAGLRTDIIYKNWRKKWVITKDGLTELGKGLSVWKKESNGKLDWFYELWGQR
ncbi:hypothetical protein ABK040_015834 [Willaertia magna]